jgi:hypothetical protein
VQCSIATHISANGRSDLVGTQSLLCRILFTLLRRVRRCCALQRALSTALLPAARHPRGRPTRAHRCEPCVRGGAVSGAPRGQPKWGGRRATELPVLLLLLRRRAVARGAWAVFTRLHGFARPAGVAIVIDSACTLCPARPPRRGAQGPSSRVQESRCKLWR